MISSSSSWPLAIALVIVVVAIAVTHVDAHRKPSRPNVNGVPTAIALMSTGVDAKGAALSVGAQDPRWKVNGPGHNGRAVVKTNGGWQQNTSTSAWIGPKSDNAPPGLYIFQLDINLSSVDPDEGDIILQFAADDFLTSLTVNDENQALPVTGTNFRLGAPYVLRGWKKGMNWIRVGIMNQGSGHNPIGFRIEATIRKSIGSMLSTGVYSNGTVRPEDKGNNDQNWVLSHTTGKYAAFVIKQNPAWLPNDNSSRWIGPSNGAWDGVVGYHTFTNAFDMFGYDPQKIDVVLQFAADDEIRRFVLNGKDMAIPKIGANFRFGAAYVLKGWHPGYNSIEVDVYNGGGPIGLRVFAKAVRKGGHSHFVEEDEDYDFEFDDLSEGEESE